MTPAAMGQFASPVSTLIIGLSGPSSSGKSTLARLLRSVFNIALRDRTLKLFILHEDDFYKPDDQIPVYSFSLPIKSEPILTHLDRSRHSLQQSMASVNCKTGIVLMH
jgi:uridine kinase